MLISAMGETLTSLAAIASLEGDMKVQFFADAMTRLPGDLATS
jgi:hypothetical protein